MQLAAQIEHLDLRDLRSVVASSDDPMVARDETTRQLAGELKAALATKQEQELQLWFGDIDAALRVGRVIRALRLSSQPPKAGVPFPTELSQRLTDGANASLTPTDGAERWCAVLEAAAFSPIRTHVAPSGPPATVADELRTTVTRLAPALPQVAAMFGIEPAPNASMPKPLRPTARPKPTKPPRKADAPAAGQRPQVRRGAQGPSRRSREVSTRRATPTPEPAADETPAPESRSRRNTAPADESLRHRPPRRRLNRVTKPIRAPTNQPSRTAPARTRNRADAAVTVAPTLNQGDPACRTRESSRAEPDHVDGARRSRPTRRSATSHRSDRRGFARSASAHLPSASHVRHRHL